MAIFCVSTLACATPPVKNNADQEVMFTSNGGKGIRLAVLQPTGVNIPTNQEWFLPMIQGSLTSDFNKFSNITVLDRLYLDDVLNEQNLSMSGNFSENDYIRIGHLTNAQYILVGSLTRINVVNFMLDLAVINPESGERLASFGPKQYSLSDIQNMFAAKDAAFELLTQVGITFTENERRSLFETAQTSISAETALSRGIAAERSGATIIEAMQYYYQAVDYDASMTEAISRLAETNNRLTSLVQPLSYVPTGNIREDALAQIRAARIEEENRRIDEQNKQIWIRQLADCENYFANFFQMANAPLELIYSTEIRPLGAPDVINETISLYFQAAFSPVQPSWFRAAAQTIASVRKGLIDTGRVNDWGLSAWPIHSVSNTSPFQNVRRNYKIAALLLDEHEKIIATAEFGLSGGWNCSFSSKYEMNFDVFFDEQVKDVIFHNVKVNDITDILSIHISMVNGIATDAMAENGLSAIKINNQLIRKAVEAEEHQKLAEQSRMAWDKWAKGDNHSSTLLAGYVYAPNLPIGFSFGLTWSRFGGYFSFNTGSPASKDFPTIDNPANPIETGEDIFMDLFFGMYVRTVNNLFFDIGLGFYGSNLYGLYNVVDSNKPVWCNIDGDEGTDIGLAMQAGLLYSFKWFYLSAGYRQYFNDSYTPSFYVGGGLSLGFNEKN
jgi:hypothetical protein